MSFIGKIGEGVGQLIIAKQETELGEFNAGILREKADAERQSQVLLENQKRRITKDKISTQVSLFGKSGVTLSGSPIDVMVDSLTNANFDIAIDKYNSEVAARGLETEAKVTQFEAKQRSKLAKVKAVSSFIGAAAEAGKEAAQAAAAG